MQYRDGVETAARTRRSAEAATTRPLTGTEQVVWRALMKALVSLPRGLNADMDETSTLSSSEYIILMHLSEAPTRSLRMIDLAECTQLTPSGTTRVVERLRRTDLVARQRSEYDGRGQVVLLTDAGFAALEAAYPSHLASVRRRVFDRLDGVDLDAVADALARIATDEAADRPTDRLAGTHAAVARTTTAGPSATKTA